MENKMLPYEERLMAYLDGEMSPAERARIDQMLEANPAARQLVDELRVLSGSLKSLPKYQLEADFYKRVLRMAEREVLTGKAPAADAVAASPLSDSEDSFASLPLSTRPRDGMLSRLSRPTVWASLTAAAALVVMIFSPDMGTLPTASTPVAEQKQVAKSTTRSAEEASAPAAPPANAAAAPVESLERSVLKDEGAVELDKSEQQLQGVDGLAKRARQNIEPAAATAPAAAREAFQEQGDRQPESRKELDGKSLEGGLRRNANVKSSPVNAGPVSDADARRDAAPAADAKNKDEAGTAGIRPALGANRSAGQAPESEKARALPRPGGAPSDSIEKPRGAAAPTRHEAAPAEKDAEGIRLAAPAGPASAVPAPAPARALAPGFGGGQGGGGGNAVQAVPPGKPAAPAPAPGIVAPSNGFAQDRAIHEGAAKGGEKPSAAAKGDGEKPFAEKKSAAGNAPAAADYRAAPGDKAVDGQGGIKALGDQKANGDIQSATPKAPQESQITGDPKSFKKDLATPQDLGVKAAEDKSSAGKLEAGKSEAGKSEDGAKGEGKGAGTVLHVSPDSNAPKPAATAIQAPPPAPPAAPGELRSKIVERSAKQFDGQRSRGGLRWGAMQATQPQGDVLVLTVKVPRHAWESGEFDEVLSSNSVLLDLEPSAPELVLQKQQQAQLAGVERDEQLKKLEPSEQTRADGENGKLALVERPAQLAAGFAQAPQAKQEAACDMSDAVYIEATTQQVEAILGDLRNRPESFLAVNCTTLPGGVSFGSVQDEKLRKSVTPVEKADGRALQNAAQDPAKPLPAGVNDPAKAANRYVQVLPNQANARRIRVTRELDRLNVQVEAAKDVNDALREEESAGEPRKDGGVKRQAALPGQAPDKVLEMVRSQLQNQLQQAAPGKEQAASGKEEKQQQGFARSASQQARQRVVFVFEVVDAPLAATPVAKPAAAAASPEVKVEPKAEK